MASHVLETLLDYAGHVWLGQHLDALRLFDRGCRLSAGRRHLETWSWLVGFWTGRPTRVCGAALVWAMVTVGDTASGWRLMGDGV